MKKKLLFTAFLMLFVSLLARAEKKEKAPLKVVSSVDLARYAGLWYEIARLPNRFESACSHSITANYSVISASELRVINECVKENGKKSKVEGVARLAEKGGSTSKLKVRFAPGFLSILPFVWGDYQIMDLAADYSYALVGEPGRKYLWILSRAPQLSEAEYRSLIDKAATQGFDVSKVIRTKQN